MSDTLYNIQNYMSYSWEEFVGFIVTSVFASFILTFNRWGLKDFDAAAGLSAFLGMLFFLLTGLVLIVTIIKLISCRYGYVMYYEPHLLGLMAGLVITVASAGYLPIFLPGGFKYKKPWRTYVGHWRGYERPWEHGILAGAFPLLWLLYIVILSPIYLKTLSTSVYGFIIACCLMAVYALIPLPNLALEYGGRVTDFYRYLRGMTFGLDVYMNSRTWYMPLATFTIVFAVLAYIITKLESKVAFWVFVIAWIPALFILYMYKSHWDMAKMGGTFR